MIVAARACEILYNLIISTGTEVEYIVPANCCNSVSMTFASAGVQPFYVDIEPGTLDVNHHRVKERLAVGAGTRRVVLYIRPYGDVQDAEVFFSELKALDPTLLIIDDRCLCFPDLRVSWQRTHADVVLFSTGGGKVVELGFGGYAFIRDGVRYAVHAHAFDPLRESSLIREVLADPDLRPEIPATWINNATVEHPAWYLARVFLWRYVKLAKHVTVRAAYKRLLPASVSGSVYPSTWRYCLALGNRRDRLHVALQKLGVFASTLYPPPARIFSNDSFPTARQVAEETLNIPYRFGTVLKLLLNRATIREPLNAAD